VSPLYRLSGAGNDFLALAETAAPPSAAEIAAWCRRGLSLGADGLFTLRRAGDAVRMDYWNADGQPARLCLNGTRCAARLAFHLGWAAGEVEVRTGAGPVRAREVPGAPTEVALALPAPAEPPRPLAPEVEGREWAGWLVDSGVPHFVLPWPEPLAAAPVAALGAALRLHPAFGPGGTNVDFVRFPSPHRLEIRSFERGVEAETLACGTGVLAAVATGVHTGSLTLPVRALTLGGFELTVALADPCPPPLWTLAGDARLLATFEPTPESKQLPPPPDWT
jgi:diaminopimelate epimerase